MRKFVSHINKLPAILNKPCMKDQIFIEIDRFDNWAQSQFDEPQDDIGGEWECTYLNWDDLYKSIKKLNRHTEK